MYSVLTANSPIVSPAYQSKHSPHKATLLAIFLPGSGQIYNKKYWKVPIVYAGFGVMSYFIISNTKKYRSYRDAYEWSAFVKDNPATPLPIPPPPNNLPDKYNSSQLLEGRQFYRRNVELMYIITGAWYILTVLDAVVDAHFFDFDIGDNLTLNVMPYMDFYDVNAYQPVNKAMGMNFTLKF